MKPLLTSGFIGLTLFSSAQAHQGHEQPPKAKTLTEVVRTGNGTFTYENVLDWGKLPENAKLGPTHGGVAVDKQGLVYVSTDGEKSLCVFKSDGTFVKAMASPAQGIHGLQIVTEGDKQFLFGAQLNAYGKNNKHLRAVKLDLDGNIVMEIPNEKTGEITGGLKGITSTLR